MIKKELKVPLPYRWVYKILIEKYHFRIVDINYIEDVLAWTIVNMNKGKGGNTKGLPKRFLFGVIEEMEYYGLIKKVMKHHGIYKYEILQSTCHKGLDNFPWG